MGKLVSNEAKPKTGNYLGLFLKGYSTEEILSYNKKNNASVYLPEYEDAKKMYPGIPEDQLKLAHEEATKSYAKYLQQEYNGNVAPAWKYAPEPPATKNNPQNLIGGTDKSSFHSEQAKSAILGVDREGNRFATEEQVAAGRGQYYDDNTKKWEKYDDSFLTNLGRGLLSIAQLTQITPQSQIASNIEGNDVYYIDYDSDKNPFIRKGNAKYINDGQKIMSAFGPSEMTNKWLWSGLKSVANFGPSLGRTAGSLLELGDNIYDKIVTGEDKDGWAEYIGEQLQRQYTSAMLPTSERSKSNPFSNGEALFSAIGSIIPQVLSGSYGYKLFAEGLGWGTTKAGIVASQWAGNSLLGLMAMDSFNQSAKESGIDQLDIAWMAPIIGSIETLTEGLIGPAILQKGSEVVINKAMLKQSIKGYIKDAVEKAGVKEFGQLSKGQKLVFAKKLSSYIKEQLPTSGIGRSLMASWEEGMEEVASQIGQNTLQMNYDFFHAAKNPMATPGDGLFGPVNKDSYSQSFLERVPDSLLESFVLGFIGGGIGVGMSGTWKGQFQQSTIQEQFAKGNREGLLKEAERMHRNGLLGPKTLDENHMPITPSNADAKTLNDVAYEKIVEQISIYDKLSEAYGLNAPEALTRNGNLSSFLAYAYSNAKQANDAREAIRAITENSEITDEAKAVEIAKQKEILVTAEQNISDIKEPESKGAKYSKYYNQEIKKYLTLYKIASDRIDQALEHNKIDKKTLDITTYNKLLSNEIRNISPDVYNNSVLFNNDLYTKYVQEKQVEHEAKVKAITEDKNNLEQKIKDFNVPTLSQEKDPLAKKEAIMGLNSFITDLDAIEFNYDANHLNGEMDRIQTILDQFKVNPDVIDNINEIESYLPNERTPEQEDYLSKNKEDVAIDSKRQELSDKLDAIRGRIKGSRNIDLATSFYSDEVDNLIKPIDTLINDGLKGSTPQAAEEQLNQVAIELQNIEDYAKISSDIQPNYIPKDNKNEKDISPINKEQAELVKIKIEAARNTLDELYQKVQELGGNRTDKHNKIEQVHTEMKRRVLEILANKLSIHIEGIVDDVKKVKEIKIEDIMSEDVMPAAMIKTIEDNKKEINSIETKIYNSIISIAKTTGKNIITDEVLKDIISFNFNMSSISHRGSDVKDYKLNYIESAIGSLKSGFLKTDVGYIYTVNYLNSILYTNSNGIYEIRKKRLEANIGNTDYKVSTYEQQEVQRRIIAFFKSRESKETVTQRISRLEKEIILSSTTKDELKKSKQAAINNQEVYKVPNSLFIRGDFATGKTQQAILESIEEASLGEYMRSISNVTVVYLNDSVRNALKPLVDTITSKGISVKEMNATEYFSITDHNHDLLIWDEASLLSKEEYAKIKTRHPEGALNMFIGDDIQMSPIDTFMGNSETNFIESKTIPLTVQYSTDYSFIVNLANTFKKSWISTQKFPKLFDRINPDGTHTGGRYYSSEDDIVKSFLSTKTDSKALVFLNNDHFNEFKQKNPKIVEAHLNDMYVLITNVSTGDVEGMPKTIQGGRRKEVYIATDLFNLNKYYYDMDKKKIQNIMASAGYTGVGRASEFIGIIGSQSLNINYQNWTEKSSQAVENDKINIVDTIKGIDNILLKNTVTAVPEKETKKPAASTYKKSEEKDSPEPVAEVVLHEGQEMHPTHPHMAVGTQWRHSGTGLIKTIVGITSKGEELSVLLSDGSYQSLNDIDKNYKSYEATPIEEVEQNMTYFKRNAIHWKNGLKAIWGSSYSVFGGVNKGDVSTESDISKIRAISTSILANDEYFEKTLTYIRNGHVVNNLGQFVPMEDLLFVTVKPNDLVAFLKKTKPNKNSPPDFVEAWNEINESNKSGNGLPKKYSYLMAIKDTEYDYNKTGGNKISGMDYIKDYDAIIEKINNGFMSPNQEEYSEIDNANREMNRSLASLRKFGRLNTEASNEFPLWSIPKISNKTEGLPIFNIGGEGTKISSFITKFEKLGLQFGKLKNGEYKVEFIQTKNGRHSLILRFAWNRAPVATDPYIIVRMPKVQGMLIDKTDIKAKFDIDRDSISGIKGTSNRSTFNSIKQGMFINELISNNKSLILSNPTLKAFFSKYVKFPNSSSYVVVNKNGVIGESIKEDMVSKKIPIISNGIVIEKRVLETLLDDIQSQWDDNVGLAIRQTLYMPSKTVKSTLQGHYLIADEFDLAVTDVEDIHHPYGYADISDALSGLEKELNYEKTTSDTATEKALLDDSFKRNIVGRIPRRDANVKTKNLYSYMTTEKSRSIISELLGENFINNRTEFEYEPVFEDGKEVLGLVHDGRIKLAVQDDGVEVTTPRHEIMHTVFNYLISEKTRQKLYKEVKELLAKKGKGRVTDKSAREYMARTFGSTQQAIDKAKDKWYTPSGLLQRFVDLVEGIYNRYISSSRELNRLMDDINKGVYRDMPNNLFDNAVYSTETYDGEEQIFEQEFEEDVTITPNKKVKEEFGFYNLASIFGSQRHVNNLRNHISYTINQYSIFSNLYDIDYTNSVFNKSERKIEQLSIQDSVDAIVNNYGIKRNYASNIETNIIDEGTNKPKRIRDINPEEIHLLDDDSTEFYDVYHMGDKKVIRAFIKNILPSIKFNKDGVVFENNGVDSIVLNYDTIDWSKKNAFLQWQLSMIPLKRFSNGQRITHSTGDKAGYPMPWDGVSFVNVPNLETSLREASIKAKENISFNEDLNYKDEFFSELRKLAKIVSVNSEKGDNILSFLDKFDRSTEREYKDTKYNQAGFNEIIENDNNPGSANYERAKELELFMNALLAHTKQLRKLDMLSIKIRNNKDGKDYQVITKAGNGFEDVKNNYVDSIKRKLFSGQSIKEEVSSRFDGDKSIYSIDSDGVYRVIKKDKVKILGYKDGNAYFPDKVKGEIFDKKYIEELFGELGLRSRSFKVALEVLYKGEHEVIAEYASEILNISPSNLMDTKTFLANGLYHMLLALDSNIKSQKELNNVLLEKSIGDITEKAAKDKENFILENAIHKEVITKYMKSLNMNIEGIDDMESLNDEDDIVSETKTKLSKPQDLYNFLNVVGIVESAMHGDEYNKWTLMPDKTRRYNFVPSSYLIDRLQKGSASIKAVFNNKIKELSDEELNRSIFIDKKGNVINAALDKKSNFELRSLKDVGGIEYYSGTKNPNPKDLITIGLVPFIKAVKSGSKMEILPITMTNFADSGNVFIGEYTFDNTNTHKLITGVDENGNLKQMELNNDMVNEHIWRAFEQKQRNYEVSVYKWRKLLSSPLETGQTIFKAGYFLDFQNHTETAKELTDYISQELKRLKSDSSVNDMFVNNVKKYLTSNFDYKNKGGNITVGNALAYNDDIYNQENYNEIKALGGLTTRIRRMMFEPSYKSMANTFAKSQYHLPEEISKLTSGKYDYYNTTGNEKSNPIVEYNENGEEVFNGYNPFMEAYFYAYHIANNAIMPLVIGHSDYFSDQTDKSKRTKPVATGGTPLIVGSKYGVGKEMHTILIDDTVLFDFISKKDLEVANGMSWGGILAKQFINYSMGGTKYGAEGKSMSKVLTNSVDMISGKLNQDKEAIDYTTSALYRDSMMHREMTKIMIEKTDSLMREEYGEWSDMPLYDRFLDFYNEDGTKDAEKAASKLHLWIVEESGYAEEIKNMLVWKIQNVSAEKGGVEAINQYTPLMGMDRGDNYLSTVTNTEDIKIILNAYKDPTNNDSLSPFTQIMAFLGVGDKVNQKEAKLLSGYLSKIYSIAKKQIDDEINMTVPMSVDTVTNEEDMYYAKLATYLRNRAKLSLEEMNSVGSYAEMLMNKNISIDVPQLRAKMLQTYSNYINRSCIKKPFTGFRGIQSSGIIYELFEDETGIEYTLSEVERELGREITLEEYRDNISADGLLRIEGLNKAYRRTYLTPMAPTTMGKEYSLKKAKMVIPMTYLSEFDVKPTETLNDLFSIQLTNGEKINLRKSTISEMIDILSSVKNRVDIGEVEIDIENTPSYRQKKYDTPMEYIYNLQDVLNIFASRTPASGLGSGAIAEVVAIINDNGNTAYIPWEMNGISDADFDIDELSLFHYALNEAGEVERDENTIKGIQNKIIDLVEEVYAREDNKDDIFSALSTESLDLIAENIDNNTDSYQLDNSIDTTINMYSENKKGSESIGIFANTSSALSMLATLGTKLKTIAPGFAGFVPTMVLRGDKSPVIRIARYLQGALDNAKKLLLGKLNISQYNTNIVGALATQGYNDVMIADFLKEDIVIQVYNEVESGASVENKASDVNVFKVIRKYQQKYKSGINETDSSLKEMQEKLKALKSEREAFSKDNVSEVNTEAFQLKLDEYNTLVKELQSKVEAGRNYSILKKLEITAYKAEALRRVSHFIGTRNGLPTLDHDFYRFGENTEQYIGMSIPEFIEGKNWTIKRHMDLFKIKSSEYNFETSDDTIYDENSGRVISWGRNDLLAIEENIAMNINIPAFLREFTYYGTIVSEYQDQKNKRQNLFFQDGNVVGEWRDNYLNNILRKTFDYANRYSGFYTNLAQVYLDNMFKQKKNEKFNLSIPKEADNGEYGMEKDIFSDVRPSRGSDLALIKKQGPQWIEFIQSTLSMDPTRAIEALKLINPSWDRKTLDILSENNLFKKLSLHGYQGYEFIIISKIGQLSQNQIGDFQKDFKKLPSDIKKVLAILDLSNNLLGWRKGSLADIMGSEIYEDISKSISDLKISSKDSANKGRFDELGNKYVNYLHHMRGMVPFLSKAEKDKYLSTGKAKLPKAIKASENIGGLFRTYVTKVLMPTHPQADNLGYVTEYLQYGKQGLSFDSESNVVTRIESIKNFTSKEINDLTSGKQVTKVYLRGHGYKATLAEDVNNPYEGTDKNKLYITDTGLIVQIAEKTAISVKWKKSTYQIDSLLEKESVAIKQGTVKPITPKAKPVDKQQEEEVHETVAEVDFTPIDQNEYDKSYQEYLNYMNEGASRESSIAMQSLSLLEGRRLSARAVKSIVEKIKRSIPGLSIINENNNTISKYPDMDRDTVAWVDNNGLHINYEAIKSTTPLHEVNHIFLAIYESINPDGYDKLVEDTKNIIANGGPIIDAIKQKYPNEGKKFFNEVMATYGGFHSRELVEGYMMDNNLVDVSDNVSTVTEASNKSNTFSDAIKEAFNWIKDRHAGKITKRNNIKSDISKLIKNDIKPGILELFESNPELANAVYEAIGLINTSEIQLDKPRFNPDNAEAISYPIKINDKYAGVISVDKDGYISSSIGMAGVELEKEFQGQGYGTKIYIALAEKLDKEGKTLKSEAFGKADINENANRVWKSLLDKGYAVDKGTYFEVQLKDKQQAQQLYSQYLDTIFPDSKVKDIVYRGKTDSQSNQKSKELGIFFTDDKSAANIYAVKYKGDEFDDSIIQGIVNKFGLNPTIEQIKSEIAFFDKMGATKEQIEKDAKEYQEYIQNNKGITEQAIVNIENPKNLTVKDWFDNYDNGSSLKENSDGILLKGGKQSNNRIYDAGENQIVVFEPEQIHILGSKQDIEGFKEYIGKSVKEIARPKLLFREYDTVSDLFDTLTYAFLNGEEIVDLTNKETKAIFDAYYSNHRDKSVQLAKKRPIASIKDFIAYFNGNAYDEVEMDVLSSDGLVEHLYADIVRSKKKNKYEFSFMGKDYSWPDTIPETALKKDIRENIVPLFGERELNIPSNVVSFAKNISKGMKQSADDAFGQDEYSETVITKLYNKLGIENNYVSIQRYSELKNGPFAHLYNEAFKGFDPIILIHGKDGDKISLSIYDISSRDLGYPNRYTNDNALTSAIIPTSEYEAKGGNLSNSPGDIRLLLLGMTLANIKNNADVIVRNIGVIDMHKNSIHEHSIDSIDKLMNEVKIVSEIKPLMDAIASDDLNEALANKNVFEETQESFVEQIKKRLLDLSEDQYTGWKYKRKLEKLTATDATMYDHIRVLQQMQREIVTTKYNRDSKLAYNDTEYQVLAKAIREIETHHTGYINSLRDMSKAGMLLLSGQNIANDISQWAYLKFHEAKGMVTEKFIAYQDELRPLHARMRSQYKLNHPSELSSVKERAYEIGSKFYKHLFKTMEVFSEDENHKYGEKVQVVIPEIHWDVNDDKTSELIKNNTLSSLDIEFANKWLDRMEEQWIDAVWHKGKSILSNYSLEGDFTYSRVDAEKLFRTFYKRGIIPVMNKSVSELIGQGSIKAAASRQVEVWANWDAIFQDMIGKEAKFDSLANSLSSQDKENDRYAKAGLYKTVSGEIKLKSSSLNSVMTMNMENIGNYFALETIRKQIYEDRVIPAFNNANAIFHAIDKGGAGTQEQNMKQLQVAFDRIAHHKNQDKPDMIVNLFGKKINVIQAGHAALSLYSGASLMFKPIVWTKSAVFNELRGFMDSLSNGIANHLTTNPDAADTLPGPTENAQALYLLSTDFKKVHALGRMFQVINRADRDLLESRYLTETNRSYLSAEAKHIGNQLTDSAAKLQSMVAYLVKEGSYESYILENGKLTYDVTKDKRFYNSDGTPKTANGEQAIIAHIRQRLINQGVQDESNPGIVRGHDYQLLAKTVRWYSNKFVIPNMDDVERTNISSFFLGRLNTTFRLFSIERLHSSGMTANTHKTVFGKGYKANLNADGSYTVEDDISINEGAWQSLGHAYKAILNMKNQSFKDWYNEQDELRRKMIVLPILQMTIASIIMGLYMGLDKEDRKKAQKFNWIMAELLFYMQLRDWFKNPIPAASLVTDAFDIAMGDKNIDAFMRYTGPVAGINDVEKYYETLFSEKGQDDDYFNFGEE